MIKLFYGILALVIMGCAMAAAAEPVGIELRMRNSIGRLGLIDAKPTLKTEADGSMVVSFQAAKEGTYYLVYTTGPKKGKNAATVNVAKPGSVTTKIKS